jgi:biotin-dependent carboxylase-like uncharacterized protein
MTGCGLCRDERAIMDADSVIEVLQSGQCDLVMDGGRYGFAHLGVPVGGAADAWALQRANRLVGNVDTAAGLEITLKGPVLLFPQGGVIALTGARFDVSRSSGGAIGWNETLLMARNEQLMMGVARSGCRCWLAVRGGLIVPDVLASHSTFLPASFGGMQGRALHAGDRLTFGKPTGDPVSSCDPPHASDASVPFRVIPGPQAADFTDAGLTAFFSMPYRVDAASDRRGVRLAGVPVAALTQRSLPSQAVLPGAIQIPPDGQPIILGWDGPVTGGYPVVAGLASVDLPRLAQLKPGNTVRFATVTLEAARKLAREAMDGY